VLAMFGAPEAQPDHAARALRAARGIAAFTERYRRDGEPLAVGFGHTRIGVHSGEALVGNIGSSRRFKYAALGDVVNTCSRIEGLNKFFATRLCASDAVRAAAGEQACRPLGDFVLKGRAQALSVFELLATEEAAGAYVAAYREAYALLCAGDAAAVARLRALAKERPDDGVVAYHLARAEQGMLTTTIKMEEK